MKKFYTFAAAALAAFSMSAQVYVVGGFESPNWDINAPIELKADGEGNFTDTLPMGREFKMSTVGEADWDAYNAGAFSIEGNVLSKANIGQELATVPNGENTMMPWEGEWTVKVSADYSKVTFSTTTPAPKDPTAAYVVGSMNGWADGFVDEWKMTTTDGITYTFDATGDHAIPANSQFKCAAKGWGGINYGTTMDENNPVYITTDGEVQDAIFNKGNCYTQEVFEGEIKLVLPDGEGAAGEFYFTSSGAGVEGVTVDNNAPAEYFTIQGVRVANPEAGNLYIVRRGAKVSKVLVK